MTVYDFVRSVCAQAGINDGATVEKLVGTARTMGFEDGKFDLSDQKQLGKILLPNAPKTAGSHAGKPVTASADPQSVVAHTRFEEIESMRGKNLCPRCKKEMNPGVKLADYQTAKYCKTCKVALWPDD